MPHTPRATKKEDDMDGRIIMVKDLRDQIGMAGQRPFLYCAACGEQASANKGDYFSLPPRYVFAHCGEPMRLVTSRTVLTDVDA
jgi:hypothetical protein